MTKDQIYHQDALINRLAKTEQLIKRIQDALATAEEGDALVEVASNACRAERELAAQVVRYDEDEEE